MSIQLDLSAVERGEIVKIELGNGDGPSIVLTGGIHGNEQTGVYTAMLTAELLERESILGRVAIMPVCNPSAFKARIREAPEDGEDLNRTFPGGEEGFTKKLAKKIYELTDGYDYMIDLHCCGIFGSTYVMSGYEQFPFQIELAEELGISPLCHTNGALSAGQLYLVAAQQRGQKGLLIELPGGQPGGVIFKDEAQKCAQAIIEFMRKRGIIADKGAESEKTDVCICGIQLRHKSHKPGLFVPMTHNGAHVMPEDVVGTLDGESILAQCEGVVTYTAPHLYAFYDERLVNIAPLKKTQRQ